jgi:hypothetical protein
MAYHHRGTKQVFEGGFTMTNAFENEELEQVQLQASKDDEAAWGTPIPTTNRRRLSAVVSVRFNPDELETIRGAAVEGNISEFIREAALKATVSQPKPWAVSVSLNSSVRQIGGSVVLNSVIQIPERTELQPNVVWELPPQSAIA